MDDSLILIESDAEESIEKDREEQLFTRVTNNITKRRSLFDLKFESSDEQKHESVELKDYESRLHQEMRDWKSVLFNAYQDLKKSKQKHPVVDKTILPPEKREYLEKAASLQHFIRESVEFRQQAVLFLEYDYAELMEMIENLESLCEHKLNLIKANKIAENLANCFKNK